MNKILEKVVHNQLTDFLCGNNILDIFQSGFRTKHSTESALLKVTNDILLSIDSGKRVALMMLDLTAAFDTLDHAILIERLRDYVGIKGVALKWFSSYLQDRTCLVKIGNHVSSSASITSGVPQGSILGPTLFSLYMLPLGTIFRQYNINYHMYADDLQLYFPLESDGHTSFANFHKCLTEVKEWLTNYFLQLNEDKSEFIMFGNKMPGNDLIESYGLLSNNSYVTNLGVFFDSEIKLIAWWNHPFFLLRKLSKLKSILSYKDLEIVLHAFISTRLDYCNALYLGISESLVARLQYVQNAAARILTPRNEII